ncbi:MAG: radical SAM protein [Candidatus Omnitrophota bacterium]
MAIHSREYKNWSADVHQKFSDKPIVMQMEITYQCPIHCLHCYSDCYNNKEYAKNELSTEEIKLIMDKIYAAGCMWFTFTGGDPMIRKDFIELYDYAKDKGFIVSVMTSLTALTDDILCKLSKKPPFSIEMTLNGVTRETYEKISQVKGSFDRAINGINSVIKAGLPIKVKTLISKNNQHEVEDISDYLEKLGLKFSPSTSIFARLNGDNEPCKYRLPVDDVLKYDFSEDDCELASSVDVDDKTRAYDGMDRVSGSFYRCAVGSWQWHINPIGRLNICSCVRDVDYDILNGNVLDGVKYLRDYVKNKKFSSAGRCGDCKLWHICGSCPGKAKLELGDECGAVDYFCELAKKKNVILNHYKSVIKE